MGWDGAGWGEEERGEWGGVGRSAARPGGAGRRIGWDGMARVGSSGVIPPPLPLLPSQYDSCPLYVLNDPYRSCNGFCELSWLTTWDAVTGEKSSQVSATPRAGWDPVAADPDPVAADPDPVVAARDPISQFLIPMPMGRDPNARVKGAVRASDRDPVTWDPVTWDPVTWDPVTWDPVTWDPVTVGSRDLGSRDLGSRDCGIP